MKTKSSCFVSLSGLLVLFAVGLMGCTQYPKEDLEEAKTALEELRGVEADVYAPEAFRAAEDAYNFARGAIQEQQEKFALFRSYSHAEVLITEAKEAMKDAKEEAEAGRERARRDAETLIGEAKKLLEAAEAAVERAPSGHRAVAKAALDDAGAVLFEAERDFKGGSFLEAQEKAEDAKARAEEVIANPDS